MAKKLLNLRLEEEMKETWERAAAEAGVPLSEFIRQSVEQTVASSPATPNAMTGVVEPLEYVDHSSGDPDLRMPVGKKFSGPDPK